MTREPFLDCCCQCPYRWGEPLLTHFSTGDPPTLVSSFGSVSCGVTAPFLLSSGSWCMQDFVCALQDWSPCFPQSCGSPIIKSRWPSRSESLGIRSPFFRSPGWEAWCGVQNLHNSVRTSLLLLFSSLWVTHPAGIGFDFIVIEPFLPSCCGFFFVFGRGVSFFGGFQHPPVEPDVQQLVAILVLSQK